MTVHAEKFNRYVFSIMDVVKVIQGLDPKITVTNMGETDFIVDYQKPKKHSKAIDWSKTVFAVSYTHLDVYKRQIEDNREAFRYALGRKAAHDRLFCAGSLYLVGRLMEYRCV